MSCRSSRVVRVEIMRDADACVRTVVHLLSERRAVDEGDRSYHGYAPENEVRFAYGTAFGGTSACGDARNRHLWSTYLTIVWLVRGSRWRRV